MLLHAGEVVQAVRTRRRSSAVLRSVSAVDQTVASPRPDPGRRRAEQLEEGRGVLVLVPPVQQLLRPGVDHIRWCYLERDCKYSECQQKDLCGYPECRKGVSLEKKLTHLLLVTVDKEVTRQEALVLYKDT